MAAPPSQIPAHSAFKIHVIGLPKIAHYAEDLLSFYRIPVLGVSKSSPESSPNATLVLAHSQSPDFSSEAWSRESLWISVVGERAPDPDRLPLPDLWLRCVENPGEAETWVAEIRALGAGAAIAFSDQGLAAWSSGNAAFGKSAGVSAPWTIVHRRGSCFELFAAGLVFAFVEELLGEDLFAKTSTFIERECLAMRPLHLGSAVEAGLAALSAFPDDSGLASSGAAMEKLKRQLRAMRGPEPKVWGGRGR